MCNFTPAHSSHIYKKYMLIKVIKVNGEALLILQYNMNTKLKTKNLKALTLTHANYEIFLTCL